jgi:hypothetical protein
VDAPPTQVPDWPFVVHVAVAAHPVQSGQVYGFSVIVVALAITMLIELPPVVVHTPGPPKRPTRFTDSEEKDWLLPALGQV